MADDSSTQALLERYEHLKGAEHHKNVLIEVSRDPEPLSIKVPTVSASSFSGSGVNARIISTSWNS